jgi:hypothetical protein
MRCLCKCASQREDHTCYLLLCQHKDCCSLTSNSGFHTISCWGLGDEVKDGEGGKAGEGEGGVGGKGGGLKSDVGQLVTFHPSRYTTVASNALFSEQRACEGKTVEQEKGFDCIIQTNKSSLFDLSCNNAYHTAETTFFAQWRKHCPPLVWLALDMWSMCSHTR